MLRTHGSEKRVVRHSSLDLMPGLVTTRSILSSDGERVALGLVGVNMVVFLAWQIPLPAMRIFMVKRVIHNPLSGRSYTLLFTSAFSHLVSSSDRLPSIPEWS